jgi:phosphoribosylanthranilate isomerase
VTRVKICGITRKEDALEAVAAGAHALGFIFVHSSPRYITPDRASSIIRLLPPYVSTVGVFVNASRGQILTAMQVSRVSSLQLHGEETPEQVVGFPCSVTKAFRVTEKFDPAVMEDYDVSACLLDAYSPAAHGGTGTTFDWDVARNAAGTRPLILSGGLTAENVGEAIHMAHPYAVDVASGVEQSPGVKDVRKIHAFVAAVREADERLAAERGA